MCGVVLGFSTTALVSEPSRKKAPSSRLTNHVCASRCSRRCQVSQTEGYDRVVARWSFSHIVRLAPLCLSIGSVREAQEPYADQFLELGSRQHLERASQNLTLAEAWPPWGGAADVHARDREIGHLPGGRAWARKKVRTQP